MQLRPYQEEAAVAILDNLEQYGSTLCVMATGCHAAGQRVLMFNGSMKPVEDLTVGDRLMGPDSTQRTILNLVRGFGDMVDIVPNKGASWRVNLDHVLTLVRTNDGKNRHKKHGDIVDVSVREWLSWNSNQQHLHKLIRTGVEFPERGLFGLVELPIEPYCMGVLLGDGSLRNCPSITTEDHELAEVAYEIAASHGLNVRLEQQDGNASTTYVMTNKENIGASNRLSKKLEQLGLRVSCESKFIPLEYLTSSRQERLELLAGLMDTDGYHSSGTYEITLKSSNLAKGVLRLAQSLGMLATFKPVQKSCIYKGERKTGTYFKTTIGGDTFHIPCRLPRKQAPIHKKQKDALRTGFKVVPAGQEQYFGFTLDGDNRYLLDDFTITHNCGKTVVLSDVIRRCPGRAILFTHREELLWQGRNKLQAMMPYEHIDIEMAEFKASLQSGSMPKCVVASVQSMHARRLERFKPELFDLLVFDEAHHCRAKSTTIYGKIIQHFSANKRIKILGVTATPDRHDGKSLGTIFKSVAYDYSLPKAIADGYLVPVKQNMVTITSLDLTAVSTYMGDLAAGSLDEVMSTERNLLGVAYPTLELAGDKKTLIFTAGVHQAHRLAEILNREKPNSAHAIDGGMASNYRRELVESYNDGGFQYLVNCNIATEGFDSPAIQCVVMARPTKSRPLYSQMLGRGTRILPDVIEGVDGNGLDYQLSSPEERRAAIQGSGKPHLLVIDFTGNSGKHRLVHPADILGGTVESPLSDELADLIDAKVTKATANKEAVDVAQVMDEAKLELEAKKRLAELQEQERVAKLREVVRASVQYTIKNINPMDVFSLPDAPKGNIGMDFAKRPTEGQVKALREYGVDVHHDQGEWWIGPPKIKAQWQKITQGAAGKLLNTLKERRKQDLCSYKQAMLLARFGENPHCTFKEAKAIIDEIAAAGWEPRKQTVDDLAAEQLKSGAENVKYKWVERRTLSAEAVSWTVGQIGLTMTPEKKRYLENCLKLNQVPRGCPVESPIQTTQERVAIEVKLPAIKTPPKPKIQQAIDF